MKFTIPKPRTASLRQHADTALTGGALSDRVKTARERLEHQHDPALLEAYSEQELANKRDAAEKIRSIQLREQLAQIESAAAAADRDRRTRSDIAEQDAKDLMLAREAIADLRRESSPHAQLAFLQRRKKAMLRNLTIVAVVGMLVSAVTVQQNIAPGHDLANPMFWLAYGLEGLISGVLITLMLTTADVTAWKVIGDDETWKERAVEVALLVLTISLNVYPFVHRGDFYGSFAHIIAPVMIAVALTAHVRVARNYGLAIKAAHDELPDTDDITVRLAELTRMAGAGELASPATRDSESTDPRPEIATRVLEPATRDTATADPRLETATRVLEPATPNPQPRTRDSEPATSRPQIGNDVFHTAIPQVQPGTEPHTTLESAPADSRGAHADRDTPTAAEDQSLDPDLTAPALTTESDAAPDGADVASEPAPLSPATAPEPAAAHLAEIADEVLRRRPRMRTPRDLVIGILAADEQGDPYTAIGKALNVHHETVLNILETARKVRHGATVVELRKGHGQ